MPVMSSTPDVVWTQSLDANKIFWILRLLPGADDDPIEATLHEANLDVPPIYQAVSYTWGAETYEHVITVGNIDVSVRYNLWFCLKCIRLAHEPLDLWIDALCIDQDTDSEKQRQIPMMGSIYRTATRVILFPGALANRNDLDILLNTNTWEDEAWNIYCAAWKRFLAMSYWTRTWVVQEIFNARRIILICPPQMASWDYLVSRLCQIHPLRRPTLQDDTWYSGAATKFIIEAHDPDLLSWHGWMTISEIKSLKDASAALSDDSDLDEEVESGWWETMSIAMQFRHTNCTERRDRLYAFQSIAEVGGLRDNARLPVYAADSHIANVWFTASLLTLRNYNNPYGDAMSIWIKDIVRDLAICLHMTDDDFIAAVDLCLEYLADFFTRDMALVIQGFIDYGWAALGRSNLSDACDSFRYMVKSLFALRRCFVYTAKCKQKQRRIGKPWNGPEFQFGLSIRKHSPTFFDRFRPISRVAARRIYPENGGDFLPSPEQKDRQSMLNMLRMSKDQVEVDGKLVWKRHMPLH